LSRPILSLYSDLWRALLLFACFLLPALLTGGNIHLWGVITFWLFILGLRLRSLWRLARQVRRFRTATSGQIILHYAPELEGKWDLSVLLERIQAELDRLTRWFSFSLRRRLVVYLFARHATIARIFGPAYGGTALSEANAIVIADDYNIQEVMRHELAHLFSARLSRVVPPLLSEGLSVWLQETYGGQQIDPVARPLLRDRTLKLSLLLKPTFFFAEPQRAPCYLLAGSFTGFLIRRYGWARLEKLFRRCNGSRFRAKFTKCFGVSLEHAEWQWRTEIQVMEVLRRRLGRNICS
jgi:hypothetical protein